MKFEENNGSQAEQVSSHDVGDGDSSQVIKLMGVGHIRTVETHEDHIHDDAHEESSSTQVEPSSMIRPKRIYNF